MVIQEEKWSFYGEYFKHISGKASWNFEFKLWAKLLGKYMSILVILRR